jgi:hypothetical protein
VVVIASMGALISALTPTIGQLGGDGTAVKAIDAITPLALALSAFPRAVLLGATSVVLLEGRIAPRWIGWTGLALGLTSLVSTGTLVAPMLFPLLAFGTLLFVVWVAISHHRAAPESPNSAPGGATCRRCQQGAW